VHWAFFKSGVEIALGRRGNDFQANAATDASNVGELAERSEALNME